MKDWKNLPILEEEIPKYLDNQYPPIEYSLSDTEAEFVSKSIFRAGQRDIINKLLKLSKLQGAR